MPNALYHAMGGNALPSQMQNMINQYRQFRQSFSGNPKQEVMNLLQSGRINQQQLNQYQQMAQQLQTAMNNERTRNNEFGE